MLRSSIDRLLVYLLSSTQFVSLGFFQLTQTPHPVKMKTVGIIATVDELYRTGDEVGDGVVSINEVVTMASTVAVRVMG